MEKKPSKFQKKKLAEWKCGLVRECGERCNAKAAEQQRRIEESELKLGVLREKLARTQDGALKRQLSESEAAIAESLPLLEEGHKRLLRNGRLFRLMENLLREHMTRGQYGYIIKKIPDALPAMAENEDLDRMADLYTIALELYEDLCRRLNAEDLIAARAREEEDWVRRERSAIEKATRPGGGEDDVVS